MDIPKLIAVLLLATLTACTDPASAPASSASTSADTYYSMKPCPESAQQFWTKFRAAVLKDDFDAAAAMTHFPLEVIGDADDRPTKFIHRKNFNKHFAYLLNLDLGGNQYEPNPKPMPKTMKEFTKAVTKPPECGGNGSQFRMGKLAFLLEPEGWRLTTFYSTDFIATETEEPLHTTPIGK